MLRLREKYLFRQAFFASWLFSLLCWGVREHSLAGLCSRIRNRMVSVPRLLLLPSARPTLAQSTLPNCRRDVASARTPLLQLIPNAYSSGESGPWASSTF
jgi:hypothetical protein